MNNLSLSKNSNTLVEKDFDFERVWGLYNRRGSKKQALKEWKALSPDDRKAVEQHVPLYVESITDPRYQKHFERYLKHRFFESEIPTQRNPFSGSF